MEIKHHLIAKNITRFCFCFALIILIKPVKAQICKRAFHIVLLGSSTAAGYGATNYQHSWAYKFEEYLKGIDTNSVVDNLAIAGTTTYAAQPTSYQPPPGKPSPIKGHNISAALQLNPDAIVINFPTNDVVSGYSLKEQEDNFERITDRANIAGVPVWVATPQPRDNLSQKEIKRQDSLFVWIKNYYKEKSVNFWTGLASDKDSILYKYSSGDGIHLNNRGHEILYKRIEGEHIPDSICLRNNRTQPVFSKNKS